MRKGIRAYARLFPVLLLIATAAAGQDSIPSQVYEKAAALFAQGNLTEAERVLKPELQKHPRAPAALGLLAVILDAQKRYDEAGRCYDQALDVTPRSVSLLNNLGNHYLERKLPERARAAFLRVIALEPNQPNANLQLAELSVAAKQGEQALRYLSHLPATAQADPAAQLLRVKALAYGGQRSAAESLLARLQEQAAGTSGLAYSAGLLLAEWGRYAEAEKAFTRALRDTPASFDIIYNLGLAAQKAGHLDRAMEVFETALRQWPNNPDCLFNLANILAVRSQPDQSVVLLLEAHNAAPQRADILFALAEASAQMSFYADAASALDQYLKLKPHDDIARRERGYNRARAGDLNLALEDLRWYARKYPRDPRGFCELGIAESVREADQALAHLTRALELDPRTTAARYARAALYYQKGQFTKSVEDLKLVLKAGSNNASALDLLGQDYLRLGQTGEASEVLAKAAELSPRDPKVLLHYSRALQRADQREKAEKVLAQFKALGAEETGRRPYGGLVEFLDLAPEEQSSRYIANLERMIFTRPEDPLLKVRFGKAILGQGKVQEALEAFRAARRQTSDPGILARCGRLLLECNQYGPACEFLEAALAGDPSKPEVRLDLAIAVFHTQGAAAGLRLLDTVPPGERQGDYFLLRAQILDVMNKPQEAAEALDRGFQAAPTRADLYFQAALFLIKHGQIQHAADLLQKSAKVVPNAPELQLTQAIVYALLQQHDTAQDLLARMEARWPEWSLPYLVHGIILTIRLRPRQAEPLLETAISLGGDNALAYYYLALALTGDDPLGKVQRAQEAIEKSLELDPQSAFTQALAGKIAYLRKDYPSAAEHLEAAIRLWPDLVEAHQTLSGVYRALGEREKSVAELKEVLRIKQANPAADQAPLFPSSGLLFAVRPASPPGR